MDKEIEYKKIGMTAVVAFLEGILEATKERLAGLEE